MLSRTSSCINGISVLLRGFRDNCLGNKITRNLVRARMASDEFAAGEHNITLTMEELIHANSVESNVSPTTGSVSDMTLESVVITAPAKVTAGNIVTGVFLFFIIILTVAGNLAVFFAVFTNKKLRSVSNVFIVSLSMADLLLGTIVMIPATFNEIFQEWIFAEWFCVIWAGFDVMLCSSSVLNVCLISLDRYIAIMSPLRYRVIMTHKRAFAMLAVAWGIAIFASFIPLTTGIHNPDLPTLHDLTFITERPQCLFIPNFTFVIIASTVTILLPIIVALLLYYRVSKEAKRQARFVGVLIAPSNMLLGAPMVTKQIREPFTRKSTVTLGIIVGAYVVTWAPFLFTNVIDSLCHCVPPKLFGAFVWLGYCNSLINPIIYPFFMRDFRKVYVKAMLKVCPCLKLILKAKKDKIFFRDSVETAAAAATKAAKHSETNCDITQ